MAVKIPVFRSRSHIIDILGAHPTTPYGLDPYSYSGTPPNRFRLESLLEFSHTYHTGSWKTRCLPYPGPGRSSFMRPCPASTPPPGRVADVFLLAPRALAALKSVRAAAGRPCPSGAALVIALAPAVVFGNLAIAVGGL